MNRLRAWWTLIWFDALVIGMLICVAGAVAELALAWGTGAVSAIRDLRGRFLRIPHDPAHPWVLVDMDLRQCVIRCATRNECRERQRHAGGRIVRTFADRRKAA